VIGLIARKKWVLFTAALLLVGLGVGASIVLGGGSQSRFSSYSPNRQAVVEAVGPQRTSDTSFVTITGLGELPISNSGPLSLTFSGKFFGARFEVRARQGSLTMAPRQARFDPGGGTRAFSYTFVLTKFVRPQCRHLSIEFRSLNGEPVTFVRGDAVIDYHQVVPPPHHEICE
jgi:hypothetical protein